MNWMNMPNIFNYLEYRDFLRDYYEEQKAAHSFFSYRYLALKLEIDPGTLLRVVQSKAHLSDEKATEIPAFLRFTTKKAEYFKTLVQFNKAKSDSIAKKLYEELLRIKDIDRLNLSELQYQYFSEWYNIPIRSLLGMHPFGNDYSALAQALTPTITAKQAQESVSLLERLGMIRKDAHGTWELVDSLVSTGDQWHSMAIRNYQQSVIAKASESLERHAKEIRDISTVTVTLKQSDLPLLRLRCEEFRRDLMRMAMDTGNPDSVYQINVQLFPMGFINERK